MAKVRSTTSPNANRKLRQPLTPEADEQQCISLAIDLVKRRLIEGTASSQETTHFLKLGSIKNRLEMEKLEEENRLLKAKTESIQSLNLTMASPILAVRSKIVRSNALSNC